MKQVNQETFVETLTASRVAHQVPYYAFYSSLWDGYTLDPALMVLPVDDHLVHRGDGVFESFKCLNGAVYNLDGHLARLARSAKQVGLTYPGGIATIAKTVLEVLHAADQKDCSVRILLSRGPGSMGVSPSETAGTVLTIVVYGLGMPFMKRKPEGASVMTSTVPIKPPFFATTKHCNYLPNVLMKQEAESHNVDFAIGLDADGLIAEGPTENIGMITADGILLFPPLETILSGTTMLRVAELALEHRLVSGVEYRPIHHEILQAAQEVLITGTTLNVVSVVQVNGQAIQSGKPGTIVTQLDALLEADILHNTALRTPYL